MECYCKKDIMSVCIAGGPQRQAACRFYEKAAYADRCMYYVFDQFCDSLRAQRHAQGAGDVGRADRQSPSTVSGIY